MTLTLRIENFDRLENGGPVSLTLQGRGAQIGRNGAMDWVLPDASRHVSSHHFDIHFEGGQYLLQDVSTNGTFLSGQSHRIEGKYPLRGGERFSVGHYIIRVDLPQAAAPSPVPQPAMPQGAAPMAPQPAVPPAGYAAPAAPPAAPPAAGGGWSDDDIWGNFGGGSASPAPAPAQPPAAVPPMPQPPRPGAISQPPSFGQQPAAPQPYAPPPAAPPAPPAGGLQQPGAGLQRPPAPGGLQSAPPMAMPRPTGTTGLQTPPRPGSPGAAQPPAGMPAGAAPQQPGMAPGTASPPPGMAPAAIPMPSARSMPPVPAANAPAWAQNAPQQARTQQPPAYAPAPAGAGGDAVLRAFCEGAGLRLEDYPAADAARIAHELGKSMRAIATEIMTMLQDRASVKHFTRGGERTMRSATGNNPLKFLPDPGQVVEAMFLKPRDGFTAGEEALSLALKDIRQHQIAVVAALQPALAGMLAGLSPDEIAEAGGVGLLGGNKSRNWERFVELWDEKATQGENGMLDVFLKGFANAYAQAIARS